jgi:hypothetical protein
MDQCAGAERVCRGRLAQTEYVLGEDLLKLHGAIHLGLLFLAEPMFFPMPRQRLIVCSCNPSQHRGLI